MHHVIIWSLVIVAGALVACADPTAPDRARDPTFIAASARHPRVPTPDSVGIPPSPIPPIYEELPLLLDVWQ